ncbi:MAG TPA: hypothetical protein VFC41_07395, partial [Anaerovoracaceae bacterium]|nr:hypothetical protein [Anaerovoracaceae bacterium]
MKLLARRTFLKKSSRAGIGSLIAWSLPEHIFRRAGDDDNLLQKTIRPIEQVITLGDKRLLKSDYGPVAFGWVLSGNVVSWSGKNSKDLLIGRCWEGLYLYPTKNFEDGEFNIEPFKVCPSVVVPTLGLPVDWNKDGEDDLIISDRRGFLYFMKRKGSFPEITFDGIEVIMDKSKGLKFNIPYENPNNRTQEDLGGYSDPFFSNYLYPVFYPDNENRINLIIGDSAGNLWWMPDISDGKRKPEYQGVKYHKPDEGIKTKYGKEYIELYGNEYAKPEEKICDEYGEPYLLGEGVNAGPVFRGGNTRPVLYKNNVTGSPDLLVLAGMKKN